MAFNKTELDNIKSKILISSELEKKTKIIKKGKDIWCCCPFHNEKTPSCKINDDLGSFYCFGCGAKGDIFTIYQDLFTRLCNNSHYVGSISFLISRILGASFRLFLVAIVLQQYVFDDFGIPFEITVVISILLIWLYTRRGGIKTIVWTDTIQTTLMILAVILSIYYINKDLGWTFSEFVTSSDFKEFNKIFVTENFTERNYFLKSIIKLFFLAEL